MSYYYGIDLGTTYTVVCAFDPENNDFTIFRYDDGSDRLPSVVYYEPNTDNVVVGSVAKEMFALEPENAIRFPKRELRKAQPQTHIHHGMELSSADDLGFILKRAVDNAAAQGHEINRVCISVPAGFKLGEREAYMNISKAYADINEARLVNEPTAALLAAEHGVMRENFTVMVFDFGGGTFDCTLAKMTVKNGVQHVDIIDSVGVDELGGADYDQVVEAYILDEISRTTGVTADELDAETRYTVASKAESMKIKLSGAEKARVKVNVNGVLVRVELTREEFEVRTRHLNNAAVAVLEAILDKNGCPPVDQVYMVGGTSMIPAVQAAVEQKFPGRVCLGDAHFAVAKGAALYAYYTDKVESVESNGCAEVSPVVVVEDILPSSFGPGVMVNNGKDYMVQNLLFRGQKQPAEVSKTYYTVEDGQTRVAIRAFESDSLEEYAIPCVDRSGNEQCYNPMDNMHCLGVVELELPAPPKDYPVQVTFLMNIEGLHVAARDPATGKQISGQFRPSKVVSVNSSATELTPSAE